MSYRWPMSHELAPYLRPSMGRNSACRASFLVCRSPWYATSYCNPGCLLKRDIPDGSASWEALTQPRDKGFSSATGFIRLFVPYLRNAFVFLRDVRSPKASVDEETHFTYRGW